MPGDMLNVSLSSRVKGRAESTGPVLAFAQVFDHLLRMGTRLATVALFVMLVERIRTPKTSVAAWLGTRVLAPPLMEFIFVSLPIILSLEASFTRGTPVDILLVRC